jgi:hypothetical protein
MKWTSLTSLIVLALFALPPHAASAQVTTATLSGVVSDQSGGSVPGATVTIRNVDTGAMRTAVTDPDGRYRASALEPGTYEVTVELQGFQKTRRDAVQLSIGQNAGLDLVLSIGKVEDVVTVTGEASIVDTRGSSVSAVVDARQIRELPLNGRDFSQLTLLQPGVLGSPTTARQVDRGMGTQVSIAGARPNQISYQLDGTDVNFQGNGSPGSAAGGLLGVETVREFQVLVNNYSAEYGRSSGGIVTAVTRSGTNRFRGAGFEFHRDESMDSRNYFDDPNSEKPPLSRNQYGGYLGGPIARERTFFFTSYEGLRQERGLTSLSVVPSRATRARTDIVASVRPYLDLYPLPNGTETGAVGTYSTQVTEPTRENYFVGKIDHSAGASNSFSLRYSWDKASVVVPLQLPLFSVDTNTKAQFIVGEHKWIITPALLNVVKVAWNKAYEATLNVDDSGAPESLYFIPNTQFGSLSPGSGVTALGGDTNTPTFIDLKSLQIAQSLTWSRGAHALKGGINFTRWFNDQDSSFTIGGRYAFSSLNNFVLGVANTFEGQAPGSTTDRKWRQNLIGIFIQDDWSARRNLTINAGVRYEFITVPTETEGRVASMPDLYAPGGPSTGRPLFKNPSLKNIAPRVGANWNIDGKGKNVLQAGGGLFFEPILSNIYRAYGNRTPPFYNTINPSNPPFPNPTGAGATTALLRLDLMQYDLKNPYRFQYNATYQRQLPGRTVVTAGFLGARGYNQFRNIEWNQAVPQILADGSYFFPAGPVRRNPAFASMRLRITDGASWYKALVVGARRRFSNSLDMQASYTFGKSEDLGSQAVGSGDFDNSFQPAFWEDPYLNKGLSDYDVRHNFVFNYTWQIPGTGDGVTRALTGGWQVAGIVTMRSGVPFSPELSFDRARALPRSGGAGQRPNLAAGASANPVLGGPDLYFDPLAFELPAVGTLGNLPRNTIIGPGYATWDGSLIKNIQMGNERRIQLRFEAFNILNRANFGLPSRIVFDSATTRVATAGRITTTVSPARQFQLGVKVEF